MAAVNAEPWLWNIALHQAGFASAEIDHWAVLQEQAFDALTQMVSAHAPYPGIVFDSNWRGLMQSEAGWWLCDVIMPEFMSTILGPGEPLDMIAAASHDGGLLSRMTNGREFGEALFEQLSIETYLRPSLAPRVKLLGESLERRFGKLRPAGRAPSSPVLSPTFKTELGELSFFTIQCLFGLAPNVHAGSMRAELWFPADTATRETIRVIYQRVLDCIGEKTLRSQFHSQEKARQATMEAIDAGQVAETCAPFKSSSLEGCVPCSDCLAHTVRYHGAGGY